MRDSWIIECRTPEGALDFTGRQPETVFGRGAFEGMSSDAMAQIIYRRDDSVVLTGDSIARWPATLDPRWVARRKTW